MKYAANDINSNPSVLLPTALHFTAIHDSRFLVAVLESGNELLSYSSIPSTKLGLRRAVTCVIGSQRRSQKLVHLSGVKASESASTLGV
ncbi:hypothetical protein ACHWQZ_G005460 [Mnemiopsis leidyi]